MALAGCVRYSDIQGSGGSGGNWDPNFGIDGGGNIDSDPCFVDASDPNGNDNIFGTTDDGLRLTADSNCIDAADGDAAPSTDMLGLERLDISDVNNTGSGEPNYADIGAYEVFGLLTVDFLNEPTGAQCTLIYNNEYYDGIWHDDGYQVGLIPGRYIVRLKPTYSSSSGLWHTADDVTVDVAPGASETATVWYWYPAVWVSDTRGDNNGDGGYDDPYQTIQYGIDNAQNVAGNVYRVMVEYGTYYEHIVFPNADAGDNRVIKLKGLNSGGMPNGDKPIVNGTYNSGYSTFKLFYVADDTLVANFYIEDGKSTRTDSGGGMDIQGTYEGGTCTIRNCTFDNNLANRYGGALCIRFHNPTIEGCVFKNNEVKYSPAQGGAIYTWWCAGDIIGCNIGLEVSNYAPSSDSDEIYTGSSFTEYVPTYQDCGIRGGLDGDYCDYDTTPPIDGGGNYQ